jgi:uncharacterized Zn-binding protein involved in type VI secretion
VAADLRPNFVPTQSLGEARQAARITDKLNHSEGDKNALIGMGVGAVVGAVVAVALLPAAATAGVIAIAVIGGASGGAQIGDLVATLLGSEEEIGEVKKGAARTLIVNQPAARISDAVKCDHHDSDDDDDPIIQGSATIFTENLPASRVKDVTKCDAPIAKGAPTVLMGGPSTQVGELAWNDVQMLRMGIMVVGLATGVSWIAMAPKALRLAYAARFAGALGGGYGATTAVQKMGGGAKAQAAAGLAGALLGGGLAGRAMPLPKGPRITPREDTPRSTEIGVEGDPQKPSLGRLSKEDYPAGSEADKRLQALGYKRYEYGSGDPAYAKYDVYYSVTSPTEMVENVQAHKIRVVKLSDYLMDRFPERYGDLDRMTALEYAGIHDTAKVETSPAFLAEHGLEYPISEDLHGLWAKPVSNAQGKMWSPALDKMNVVDHAVEDAFFTKRGITDPAEVAKYKELGMLSDNIDKGADPMSSWEELGRPGVSAGDYYKNSSKYLLSKDGEPNLTQKDLDNIAAGKQRQELIPHAETAHREYSQVIPETDQYLNYRTEPGPRRRVGDLLEQARTGKRLYGDGTKFWAEPAEAKVLLPKEQKPWYKMAEGESAEGSTKGDTRHFQNLPGDPLSSVAKGFGHDDAKFPLGKDPCPGLCGANAQQIHDSAIKLGPNAPAGAALDANLEAIHPPIAPTKPAPAPELDIQGIKVTNDGMATWVKVASDPKAVVRIENGYDGQLVTDIFRGNLAPGSGSKLLVEGLKSTGLRSGDKLVMKGIINPETLATYQSGGSPADALLGKVGAKAIQALGKEVSSYEFQINRGKLDLVIGVK